LRFAGELDNDPDLLLFTGIDSETDALPMGADRIHWAHEALEKLKPEIEAAEKWAQELGRPTCQRLIDRFGVRPAD
jgi:hypothetical protein